MGYLVLPTYLPAAPDRNPMFLEKRVYQGSSGKIYPLPFTDRIAEIPVDRKWKAIWIENEFLRVLVLPEIGGRIHAIMDKTNGYDLIYNQTVIKPALVGLAGPWVSGGIEFNWPQHHRPATFMPVDFEIEHNTDGSKTVWCSDHDPISRMKGMHGVCLHPDRAYLELKVRAYNRTPFVQTFLWWANVATRVHEAYQSFFPPDIYYIADHARRSMSEYPLASGHYYGVNYGERGHNGVPAPEVPAQFAPLHSAAGSELSTIRYQPNDLSFYANIPVPTSYMCMGSKEDFFGGYDYKVQAGIVHVANHHISPGKKQWTWGNHEFGYAWDRNLTESDAYGEYRPYIELMAGVYTDNQPDFSFLQPGETKSWSQYWYPIQKIGAAQHANLNAAISLRKVPSGNRNGHYAVQLGVAVTSPLPKGRITLTAKGKLIAVFNRSLSPAEPLVERIKLPHGIGETDLRVCVMKKSGQELIAWQPKPAAKGAIPSPATEPPAPSDIATMDELFITGQHLDQYRHATRCPTLYWWEALRRDPGDARCNNATGLWHFRRGEFTQAEIHFRRAIERLTQRNTNPYDGEPHYNLGLCLRYQLDTGAPTAYRFKIEKEDNFGSGVNDALHSFAAAYAAFYKATWNQAWAGAGFHALSEMDCLRWDWPKALEHLDQSLRFDTDNLRARNLKVLVLRELGKAAEAAVLLLDTLRLDPLDWWARHLKEEELTCDLQTHLDIAHDYARAGFYAEAIKLLAAGARRGSKTQSQQRVKSEEHNLDGTDASPTATLLDQSWGALPLVHYTLGWLEEKRLGAQLWLKTRTQHGDSPNLFKNHEHSGISHVGTTALRHYRAAATLKPDYCFPSRLEEIAILEAAMHANPADARAPYYLGNLLYDRRRQEAAIRQWERSAKLDPNFSVVWRNLGIGYFNIRCQPAKARATYDKALKANPSDARLLYERDQLWKRLGESPTKRLRELEKYPELLCQRDDLNVELCALYNQTGGHEKALELVRSRKFQPWEGGEGAPLGQWVRSNLALGRQALVHGDAAPACEYFIAALSAPENLGEARHLLANQSDIHFWIGCAMTAFGDKSNARRHWLAAATSKGDFQEMSVSIFSELTYYSALSLERLGKKAKAKKMFTDLLIYARRLQQMKAKIDYFATSLPTMLLFTDDPQFRQETTSMFLQAQAQLGLQQVAKSKTLLKRVLDRDPNHALAADLLAKNHKTL